MDRALASHGNGPGSIPGLGIVQLWICVILNEVLTGAVAHAQRGGKHWHLGQTSRDAIFVNECSGALALALLLVLHYELFVGAV